jgi:YbbR domain-containing protein
MKTNKTNVDKKNNTAERKTKLARVAVIAASALGALFLWIYAIGYDSTQFERTFDGIQVVFEGEEQLRQEKGFTLPYKQENFSISIVAQGKRSELNSLDATSFKAVIDISKAEEAGEQTFDIVVQTPNGITVSDQSSYTATILVDEFTIRPQLLNVNPDKSYYTTKYAEDIIDHKFDINPKTVVVEGPKSILDKIAEVYVDFDLDGSIITDDIKGWGAICLRDKNGTEIINPYIKLSETTAYFMIEVVKEKTVPVKYDFKGETQFQPLQNITLSHDSITVQGPSSALNSFNEYIITIDETTIGSFTEINHLVSLPDKISRAEGTPSEIKVRVDLRADMATRSFRFSANEISVTGAPDNVVCNIRDNVNITIVGLKDVVSLLKREDIKVSLDYGTRTPNPDGSFKSEITVDLGESVVGAYAVKDNKTVSFNIYYK